MKGTHCTPHIVSSGSATLKQYYIYALSPLDLGLESFYANFFPQNHPIVQLGLEHQSEAMTAQAPTWLCGEELPDLSAAFTSALSNNPSTPGSQDLTTMEYLRALERFVCGDDVPLAQADDETITDYTSRLGGITFGNVSLDIDRNFRVQIRKQNSSCYRAATAGNIEQLKTELCALERLLDEG